MADGIGQALIRGIDIDKIVKGFAEEESVFKQFCAQRSLTAREFRYYTRTASFLTATSPATIQTSEGAKPTILEKKVTRNSGYAKKFFVASEYIDSEDIKDSDVGILNIQLRELSRAVANDVDGRIWNVATESQSPTNINDVTSTAAWDAASGQDPIEDIMEAEQLIREDGYDASQAQLWLSPKDYKSLINWIVSDNGTNVPQLASELARSGNLRTILGFPIKISKNVTADYAALIIPNRAVTWNSFMPITTRLVEDMGIGTQIRVWEEGEAVLTDPNAVALISNTQA